MIEALIIDTETTDVESPEVIELAWQGYARLGGEALNTYCERFLPSRPSKFGALAVHHILDSELEGLRPASDAPSLVPTANFWIGHNVDFDWKALGRPDVKRICTLAMARHLWPEVDSHAQSALTYYLFGRTPDVRERLRSAHSAAADVSLTANILNRVIAEVSPESWQALWEFSERARIPRTFTFGKFRGQPIAAADRGYAQWYARQPDPDPYLIHALRLARLL